MFELRFVDDVLQVRNKELRFEAGLFAGLSLWGPWRNVPKVDFFADRELSVEEAAALEKAGVFPKSDNCNDL